jgi:hypothetical protein
LDLINRPILQGFVVNCRALLKQKKQGLPWIILASQAKNPEIVNVVMSAVIKYCIRFDRETVDEYGFHLNFVT